MKRRGNALIQLMILTLLGGAVILTLLLPRLPARREAAELTEISVILREADTALWSNIRLGMEQAAAELRAELRVLTLSAMNDGDEQLQALRREVEQQTDALIVVPADAEALSQALRTQPAACPVVSMESPLQEAGAAVAPDNEALGRELALAAVEDGRSGFVLLVTASPGSAGVAARLAGAREALEEAGVVVRERTADLTDGGDSLKALLRQPDISAVMVFEPALTEAAAAMKESLELAVPLYGVGVTANGADWLERGVLSAAAAWSDFAAGYLAVEAAVRLTRGEDCREGQLPFFVIRGEDVYEPAYQRLLFPVTA